MVKVGPTQIQVYGKRGVLKVVDANQVKAKGKQPITSTWTMKKKLDGTYRARLVARGFQ